MLKSLESIQSAFYLEKNEGGRQRKILILGEAKNEQQTQLHSATKGLNNWILDNFSSQKRVYDSCVLDIFLDTTIDNISKYPILDSVNVILTQVDLNKSMRSHNIDIASLSQKSILGGQSLFKLLCNGVCAENSKINIQLETDKVERWISSIRTHLNNLLTIPTIQGFLDDDSKLWMLTFYEMTVACVRGLYQSGIIENMGMGAKNPNLYLSLINGYMGETGYMTFLKETIKKCTIASDVLLDKILKMTFPQGMFDIEIFMSSLICLLQMNTKFKKSSGPSDVPDNIIYYSSNEHAQMMYALIKQFDWKIKFEIKNNTSSSITFERNVVFCSETGKRAEPPMVIEDNDDVVVVKMQLCVPRNSPFGRMEEVQPGILIDQFSVLRIIAVIMNMDWLSCYNEYKSNIMVWSAPLNDFGSDSELPFLNTMYNKHKNFFCAVNSNRHWVLMRYRRTYNTVDIYDSMSRENDVYRTIAEKIIENTTDRNVGLAGSVINYYTLGWQTKTTERYEENRWRQNSCGIYTAWLFSQMLKNSNYNPASSTTQEPDWKTLYILRALCTKNDQDEWFTYPDQYEDRLSQVGWSGRKLNEFGWGYKPCH
jgi:hypothetical protein